MELNSFLWKFLISIVSLTALRRGGMTHSLSHYIILLSFFYLLYNLGDTNENNHHACAYQAKWHGIGVLAATCADGKYKKDGKCVACTAGYKCKGGTRTKCNAGTYSAAKATSCTKCKTGTYQPKSGQSSCLSCPAGSYSDSAGAKQCTLCSTGHYQSSSGKKSCSECKAGSFTSMAKGSSASPNAKGSLYCNQCPAGYKCSGSTKTACPSGQYQGSAGGTKCIQCQSGYFTATSASSTAAVATNAATHCNSCPQGHQCNGVSKVACSLGQYQSSTGSSSCNTCIPGYFPANVNSESAAPVSLGAWYCVACPRGSRCTGSTKILCAPGTYQSQNGKSSCEICSLGSAISVEGSAYCIPCTSGQFPSQQPNIYATPVESGAYYCLSCPDGFKCDGRTRTACPPGTYGVYGGSTCIMCPEGVYSSTASSSCLNCPPGRWSTAGSSECTLNCAAGWACARGIRTRCLDGQYSGTGAAVCANCSGPDQFTDNGHTTCNQCEPGYIAADNHLSCTPCKPGTAELTSGTCIECPRGTYSEGKKANCVQCPGNDMAVDGNGVYTEHGAVGCTKCPAGSRCNGGIYQGQCPPGQVSSEGDGVCHSCSTNQFAADIGGNPVPYGGIQCRPCTAGFICSDGQRRGQCAPGTMAREGDGYCSPCEGSTFQPMSGRDECMQCPPGNHTVATVYGNDDCVTCPSGYKCDGGNTPAQCGETQYAADDNNGEVYSGATQCLACKGGHSCNGTLGQQCARGSVSAAGAGKCTPCEPTTYPAGDTGSQFVALGATRCIICPAGSECPNGSAIMPCDIGGISDIGQAECTRCSPDTMWVNSTYCDACSDKTYSAFHLFQVDIAPDRCTGLVGAASADVTSTQVLRVVEPICQSLEANTSTTLTCGLGALNIEPAVVTPFIVRLHWSPPSAGEWLENLEPIVLIGGACGRSVPMPRQMPMRILGTDTPACYKSSIADRYRSGFTTIVSQSQLIGFARVAPIRKGSHGGWDADVSAMSATLSVDARALIIDPDVANVLRMNNYSLVSDLSPLALDPLLWVDSGLRADTYATMSAVSRGTDYGCQTITVSGDVDGTILMTRMQGDSLCRGSTAVQLKAPPTRPKLSAVVSMGNTSLNMSFTADVTARVITQDDVIVGSDTTAVFVPVTVAPYNASLTVSGCGGVATASVIGSDGQRTLRILGQFERDAKQKSCQLTLHVPGYSKNVTVTRVPTKRTADLILKPKRDSHGLLLGTANISFSDREAVILRGKLDNSPLCFDDMEFFEIPVGETPVVELRPCNLGLRERNAHVIVNITAGDKYYITEGETRLPPSALGAGLAWGLPFCFIVVLGAIAVPVTLHILRRRRATSMLSAMRLEAEIEAALRPLLLDDDLILSTDGLGAGGFGRVVRGTWHESAVAVKLLHASLADDHDALSTVAQEAVLQASLRHPHIVELFGVTVLNNSLALVLELCDGGLQKAVYAKSYEEVSLTQRLRWLQEAASGLAFMHARGLAHRDIKAANVLLAGGRAKVTDLGLARGARQGAQATGMTLALGTPAWCAPEVIERAIYDEKAADVYAFGVTIWEVLSGVEPFADVPVLAITVAVVRGARPPIDPNWNAGTRELILACWETKPEARIGMTEVATRLERLTYEAARPVEHRRRL